MGHASIFATPGISSLCLSFTIAEGCQNKPHWKALEWSIPTVGGRIVLEPVEDTTGQLSRSGVVVFRDLPEWPAQPIYGQESQWLACRVVGPLPSPMAIETCPSSPLPSIAKVTMAATWETTDSTVEAAFFNNLPLDLSKDFFPLGERPRFGDVWYLTASAFARPRARVSLRVKLTNPATGGENVPMPPVNTTGNAKIRWEYWNGQRWNTLECQDGTADFTRDGEVRWEVPSSVTPCAVNGTSGVWVRARLVAGNYGEDERLVFSQEELRPLRVAATLAPPSVQSLKVTSSAQTALEAPQVIIASNNLEFATVEPSAPFQPFRRARHPERALYFGFEVPDDDHSAMVDRPLDLYFHITGAEHRTVLRDTMTPQLPALLWQYWNGKAWTAAAVGDSTASLTLPGIVSLQAGEDIAPWRESSVGAGLYWVRVLWQTGTFAGEPQLRRILLNTTVAAHVVTLRNELLGSSTGLPHQVFRTARTPILRELHLEVREPTVPSDEEAAQIRREEGDDTITLVHDPGGKLREVWVRWHEVDHLWSSRHDQRHFTVDRETGEICFGDGTKGAVPPRGANNVRLSRYQVGGGSSGNKSAGSIVQLRTTIPYVDAVVNLEPALGGHDVEDWEAVKERGSSWLRHRARAVTQEDYEDLARQASSRVAKARCYSNRDLLDDPHGHAVLPGTISVIIVPQSNDPQPTPDLVLLSCVRDFLNERRSPDTNLVLLAPEYVKVSVEVTIVASTPVSGASLVVQCERELERFLHPLTGGADGKGWEFGQQPAESDLYVLLESLPGLEYVRSLSMAAEEERPGVLQSGLFLIAPGRHRVRLEP
jgi:hypothetical protein